MDDQKPRKESLNFWEIFQRRRNSIDEPLSIENSRKNSAVNNESFKSLVSLMVVSKAATQQGDQWTSGPSCPLDSLTSPLLIKKSWLDPPFRPVASDYNFRTLREDASASPADPMAGLLYSNERDDPFSRKVSLLPNIKDFGEDILGLETLPTPTFPTPGQPQPPETHIHPLFLPREMKLDFNLEADARRIIMESFEEFEPEKRKLLFTIGSRIRRDPSRTRDDAIQLYRTKKLRRRQVCQVKYKVRQDLACKRLRVKGKFVKSSKVGLLAMVNNILLGSLIRRASSTRNPAGQYSSVAVRLVTLF